MRPAWKPGGVNRQWRHGSQEPRLKNRGLESSDRVAPSLDLTSLSELARYVRSEIGTAECFTSSALYVTTLKGLKG